MEESPQTLLESYHLLSYDTLDSTNEEAKRLAGGGATHGAVIWSLAQEAGKGRMGREWVSPEGNLYVSFLLRAAEDMPTNTQLAFVSALAVRDTLASILPDEGATLSCKWPNDILLGDKKIAGVLLESFAGLSEESSEAEWVVVGIGVNVDSHPENVRTPATSLRGEGVDLISAKIVLSRLVYHFIMHYDAWKNDGYEAIRKAWQDSAYKINTRIRMEVGDEAFEGIYQGIDTQGRVRLCCDDGEELHLSAGDIHFLDV